MLASSVRVLLLDDNEAFSETLGLILKAHGCDVVACGDPEDALCRCRERPFDLVLLDLCMPRMDGVEVTRRLRSAGEGPRVVMTTGCMDPRIETDALSAGAHCVLHKPVDPRDILREVDAVRQQEWQAAA
ncbi:MAG: response regulator [Armatimonadetes bacterium]|nr:response regulator [Armatimonadota bacterium]